MCGQPNAWKPAGRDDVFGNLQLETYPDVQRAILGFARHETLETGRQFPRPSEALRSAALRPGCIP